MTVRKVQYLFTLLKKVVPINDIIMTMMFLIFLHDKNQAAEMTLQ